MWWFRLAVLLHTPIARLKAETTSTEFLQWCWYIREVLPNEFHREDILFARLTAEVRRGWVEDKRAVNEDDFLLKFKTSEDREQERQTAQKTAEEAAALAKSLVFPAFGFKVNKKSKEPQ